MRNFRRVTPVQTVSLVLFFLLIFATAAAADDWAAPTRALEKKIAEKLKPGQNVAFSLQNLSSLPADAAALVRNDLELELRANGLHVKANGRKAAAASEEGIAEVRVTLAENSQGFLWVAEIRKGEERAVVMLAVPRAPAAETSPSVPAMLLQSHVLLGQETPILDFAVLGLPPGSVKQLLVLEPARVALYSLGQGGWQLAQTAAFPATDLPQRDLRGSLTFDPLQRDMNGNLASIKDSFSAILPGEICRGVLRDTLALKCEYTGRRPWDEKSGVNGPDRFSEIHRDASAYSVARIQVKGKGMQIDAGKDGVARLYRSDEPKGFIATFSGWGSDLAALKTGCGSGWQLLVTRATDYTERDSVQAFEITDKQAVPASPPLEFAGPVMALHASPGADAGLAVVRNLQTGQYEAHVFSLSCGH